MKSLKWSLYIVSTLLLHTSAQIFNSPRVELDEAIRKDIESAALDLPFSQVQTMTERKRTDHMVLYWGQGDGSEKRLSYYCDQEGVSIIVMGFIVDFIGGPKRSPVLNLSNNCNDVENCVDTARDILYCQKKGIKVLMSVGGAVGKYHSQQWDPDLFAWWMWNKFLGGTDRTVSRPFGNVILDGVDYDPESVDGVGYDRHIDTLRQLYKTQYPPREYLITAAPQCPDLEYYPKNAVYNILHPAPKYDAYPDMVFVQFYNNRCSASSHQSKRITNFNFDEWDKWSRERTKGRTQVLLGLLGKENHQDTGYVNYEKLTLILDDIRTKKSFAGVMFWDAGYAYNNPVSYLKNLQFGQLAAKYVKQLTTSVARTAAAFDNLNVLYKNHRVPILVPLFGENADSLGDAIPCAGQAFLLLRSVTGRVLAESFGISADMIDNHLEALGMDGDDPINPGSRICLRPKEDSIIIGYIYNTTLASEQDTTEYYHK